MVREFLRTLVQMPKRIRYSARDICPDDSFSQFDNDLSSRRTPLNYSAWCTMNRSLAAPILG